jgi:uncharacterized protein (DUF1015 family)
MPHLAPFRGVRPDNALAGEIIAPPYDVLDRAEARAVLANSPRSFLAVTRPDATLPDEIDEHGPEVYAAAREALDDMIAAGTMIQDEAPRFYLYSQGWRGRTQVGLMAAAKVADYDAGLIKKHELTRPDKEQDRVDHIRALDAQTGLVFLGFRSAGAGANAQQLLEALADRLPVAWSVTTDDAVQHTLQVVEDASDIAALQAAFDAIPALYVADGHHRSAAASRVCAARGGAGGSDRFLVGVYPEEHLRVLAYNRVVADLNGHSPEAFLAAVQEHFTVTPAGAPVPEERGQWSMYLGGAWHRLTARPGVVPEDPVGRLDVAVLQDRVLGPILGIDNPRTNTRIRFVGGIRGHEALEAAVDGGAAVAFQLFPTGLDQLFDVADADRLMPPKSTWFEPKLRGGVVVHRLEAPSAG